MDKKQAQALAKRIKYKDWEFYIGDYNGHLYLQVKFEAPDNYTGEQGMQSCRKHPISSWATVTEFYDTAFFAVQRAELHEAAENFWVDGALPFCPHLDFEARLELAKEGKFDSRP
jgi:hypothetical protein